MKQDLETKLIRIIEKHIRKIYREEILKKIKEKRKYIASCPRCNLGTGEPCGCDKENTEEDIAYNKALDDITNLIKSDI